MRDALPAYCFTALDVFFFSCLCLDDHWEEEIFKVYDEWKVE